MRQMTGFDDFREQSRMTWSEQEHGWVVAPEEIVNALSDDGFDECKREMTASRRDRHPAGGLWEGINTRTGSVASVIWMNHPARSYATVFIEVDGESLTGPGRAWRANPTPERHMYQDDGGEG